jgi:transposase InsO family protein
MSEILLAKIKEILSQFPENDNYGAKRVHTALEQQGIHVSYSTVYRIMKANGLLHKAKRHPNGTTHADAEAQKAENILQRNFLSDKAYEKWLTDITEVPCADGKLYIAAVLDCYNGEIVGLAMDDNMRKELCIEAFNSACELTGARGMILHSDRGCQFTSNDFRKELEKFGAIQSMSGTGCCYDNARMESFFATLKKEKLYRICTARMTMDQVKTIVFRYIMVYYNRQRVCSFNPGGWPPVVYKQMCENKAA